MKKIIVLALCFLAALQLALCYPMPPTTPSSVNPEDDHEMLYPEDEHFFYNEWFKTFGGDYEDYDESSETGDYEDYDESSETSDYEDYDESWDTSDYEDYVDEDFVEWKHEVLRTKLPRWDAYEIWAEEDLRFLFDNRDENGTKIPYSIYSHQEGLNNPPEYNGLVKKVVGSGRFLKFKYQIQISRGCFKDFISNI